jgi:hypothetical protein
MQTNPRDERDIRNDMLLPPGEYDFEVAKATEKVSKSGNDMIELQLRIFTEGSPRLLKDWLVSGTSMGDLKINRFCHATGLQDAYFADELTGFSCEGATGRVKLTITSSEQYGDQNGVRDYIVQQPDDQAERAVAEPVEAPAKKPKGKKPPARAAAADLYEATYEETLAGHDDSIPF